MLGHLDLIDVEAVAADPKPMLGYSDISLLHLVLYARTGLVGFPADLATPGLGGAWQAAPSTRDSGAWHCSNRRRARSPGPDRAAGQRRSVSRQPWQRPPRSGSSPARSVSVAAWRPRRTEPCPGVPGMSPSPSHRIAAPFSVIPHPVRGLPCVGRTMRGTGKGRGRLWQRLGSTMPR
nr:LD-carboxypeptidase [Streptomyces flavofungini]